MRTRTPGGQRAVGQAVLLMAMLLGCQAGDSVPPGQRAAPSLRVAKQVDRPPTNCRHELLGGFHDVCLSDEVRPRLGCALEAAIPINGTEAYLCCNVHSIWIQEESLFVVLETHAGSRWAFAPDGSGLPAEAAFVTPIRQPPTTAPGDGAAHSGADAHPCAVDSGSQRYADAIAIFPAAISCTGWCANPAADRGAHDPAVLAPVRALFPGHRAAWLAGQPAPLDEDLPWSIGLERDALRRSDGAFRGRVAVVERQCVLRATRG
jgi:hypothetical protein